MSTDFSALITRLANELDGYRQMLLDDRTVTHRLSDEARAALALADEPAVPEGREPTVMEIIELSSEIEAAGLGQVDFARAVLARWSRPVPEGREPAIWTEGICGDGAALLKDGVMVPVEEVVRELNCGSYARAVLARWGTSNLAETRSSLGDGEVAEKVWPPSVAASCHEAAISAVLGSPEQQLLVAAGNTIENLWQELHQTVPVAPALATEGEVGELVAWLRERGQERETLHLPGSKISNELRTAPFLLRRAAELLQRQALVPVAVSDRLPGPEDCDAEGRCWLGGEMFATGDPTWVLGFPAWAQRFPKIHRYWLPAHALPLPEAESEQ